MEDISPMHYEYFIRRCHSVARYGIKGADADDFRRLQGLSYEIGDTLTPEKKEKVIAKYKNELTKIKGYVDKAMSTAFKKFGSKFTDAETEILSELQRSLPNATLEELNEIINNATGIMVKHEIFPA